MLRAAFVIAFALVIAPSCLPFVGEGEGEGGEGEGEGGEGEGEGDIDRDAGFGDAGAGDVCAFNRDCGEGLRCECSGDCVCAPGDRGFGKNGLDTCAGGNDCESSVCVEDSNGGFTCSGECVDDGDCQTSLPFCTDVAFVGRICIRDPNG
jgi:hypothetical protein